MKSIIIFILVCFFVVATGMQTFAGDKCSVSGIVHFRDAEGQFIVRLMTFDEFDNSRKSPNERILILTPSQQELDSKIIAFKFTDVPKGKYSVYCLHDLNSNGEMDRVPNVGIPSEPYGFSGPLAFGKAMWEDVSFDVDKDVSGIEITFQ